MYLCIYVYMYIYISKNEYIYVSSTIIISRKIKNYKINDIMLK